MAVIETVRLRLGAGASPEAFVAANAAIEAHLARQPGFVPHSRRMALGEDGTWHISLRWESAADADASMASFGDAAAAAPFMALVDPASLSQARTVEVPSPDDAGAMHARGLYLDGIRDGNPREAVARHTGDRYTQHSTGVRDGADGFVEFFEPFLIRNPKRDVTLHRTLVDGPYVFVHASQSLNDGAAGWVTTDLFATDAEGRVVEHWDVISPLRGTNPSGRTQVDGPTEVTDLAETENNKAVVRRLLNEGFAKAPTAPLHEFISADEYLQHNPDASDGLDGLTALMAVGAARGEVLHYERVHRVVGHGCFVATLSHQVWNGTDYAAMDLFRLRDGLVVEHWDNVEPLPTGDALVNSGKF